MPSLENIESFKRLLSELGNEPAILEARGEEIEDVTPPEAEDLSGLFDDEIGLSGMDLAEETASEDEGVSPDDIDDGALFDVGGPSEDPSDAELGAAIDIDDIFPTSDETPSPEPVVPQPEEPEPTAAESGDGFESVSPDIDDFSFPEDTQFDEIPDTTDEPSDTAAADFDDAFFGEAGVGEEAQDVETEDGVPAEAFSFDQPLIEESDEEVSAGTEVPTVPDSGDEAEVDEFALPDDFALDDTEAVAEAEPRAGESTADESATDELALDDFDLDAGFDLDESIDVGEAVEGDIAEGDATVAEAPAEPEDEGFSDDLDTFDFADEVEAVDSGGEPDATPEPSEDAVDLDDFGFDFDADDVATGDTISGEAGALGDAEEENEYDISGGFDDSIADGEDFAIPDGFDLDEPGVETGGDEEISDDSAEETWSVPDEFSFDDESDSTGVSEDAGEVAADGDEFAFGTGDDSDAEEVLEATDEDDFDLDDFSLGDIGEEFGLGDETTEELSIEEAPGPPVAASDQLSQIEETIELTDPQFETLQETLNTLPRNLRLIIEELIGEEELAGDDLRKLIDALVRGRSPKDIAAIAGAITGESIVIPTQYEKRTGLEFEEERGTFAYVFRRNIWPALRVVLAGIGAVVLVGYLGYRLVYRPIRAAGYYRTGYEKLVDGSYLPANDDFARGADLWNRKVWYYRYAEGFRERRREDLAAEKYDDLLESFPGDRRGLLDYADLETYDRARYEHSEQLLRRVLDDEMYDYDALVLLGDTYMEWAEEAPEKYENARYTYATLLERFGNRDEVMQRMLRYFVRTDNAVEVRRLTNYFQNLEGAEIDPRIYAELGGYYIDRNELEDVKQILFRALDEDSYLADVHYHLARYFKKVDDISEESRALSNAYGLLRNDELHTVKEERMFIDTIARQGEVAYRREQYLEAQSLFIDALDRYEDALDRGRLAPDPMFGRIYAALGDVFYYKAGQSEPALYNYLEAERNDFVPPELRYKIGSIRYRNIEYDEALLKFFQAAGDYSANVNLMYATANTLYERGNYSAAQGYYLHVLGELETQRRNIPVLRPDDRDDHRALVANLMRSYNNLGATLFRLSETSGEEAKVSKSLAYLTRSSEFFDRLTRDRETLVRTESKNLSYLNTRSILYPSLDFDVEIYNGIPRDMVELEF